MMGSGAAGPRKIRIDPDFPEHSRPMGNASQYNIRIWRGICSRGYRCTGEAAGYFFSTFFREKSGSGRAGSGTRCAAKIFK